MSLTVTGQRYTSFDQYFGFNDCRMRYDLQKEFDEIYFGEPYNVIIILARSDCNSNGSNYIFPYNLRIKKANNPEPKQSYYGNGNKQINDYADKFNPESIEVNKEWLEKCIDYMNQTELIKQKQKLIYDSINFKSSYLDDLKIAVSDAEKMYDQQKYFDALKAFDNVIRICYGNNMLTKTYSCEVKSIMKKVRLSIAYCFSLMEKPNIEYIYENIVDFLNIDYDERNDEEGYTTLFFEDKLNERSFDETISDENCTADWATIVLDEKISQYMNENHFKDLLSLAYTQSDYKTFDEYQNINKNITFGDWKKAESIVLNLIN